MYTYSVREVNMTSMYNNKTTDLNEALSNASSVPEAIQLQIEKLRNSGDFELSILANRLEAYYNHICNRNMLNMQRDSFNGFYDEIDKTYPDILFRIEGRRKSLLSAYQKLLQKPSDYVLQDISAFRITLFGKEEMVDMCYRIAELIINYNVNKGFIPCSIKYTTPEPFDSSKFPDVVVPKKSTLPENMQKYTEDYILHPRSNGYQSIQITFRDTYGYFFEVQIRTISMHIHAEFGAASHASYKKQTYDELQIDRSAINIPGYYCMKKPDGTEEILDFVGLEESSEILRRQKTYA